ncbi:MAG: CBS domain-containing protein [Myxococcales bacterium]|nr:CBS domain-containing protein [Myxococcales bacterium]
MTRSLAKTAADVMATDVFTASPRWTLEELERMLCKKRVSGFPVVEGQNLVGVVSRSDVIRTLCVERSRAGEMGAYFRAYDADEEANALSLLAEEQTVSARMSHEHVSDVMSPPTFVVAPTAPIREVASLLWTNRIHRLPVTEGTRLVGIISSLDLVRLLAE